MAGRPDIGGKARVRSVPYERFARSCTVAAGLKNPVAPELDQAMAEFAPFAVQLSKDLAMANTYYQKGEHEKDDFAKGKEYHQKLTEAFGKLDEHHKKLADALAAWSKANPLDESGYTEAQKLGIPAIVEARAAILALDAGDKEALAAKITKLDEASAALKKWGEDNKDKNDPWPRILVPAIENYVRELRGLGDDPKKASPDQIVSAITMYTRVLESNHRALTRSLTEKSGIRNPRMLRPQMPAGHPQ